MKSFLILKYVARSNTLLMIPMYMGTSSWRTKCYAEESIESYQTYQGEVIDVQSSSENN